MKQELLGKHVNRFDWDAFNKREAEREKETSAPYYPLRKNAPKQILKTKKTAEPRTEGVHEYATGNAQTKH